jgi:hypothetical protein
MKKNKNNIIKKLKEKKSINFYRVLNEFFHRVASQSRFLNDNFLH